MTRTAWRAGLLSLLVFCGGLVFYTNLDDLYYHPRPSTRTRDSDVPDMVAVLRQKVRVLCWIMTSPKTINTKARAINQTWARHCDKSLYMSSKPNLDPPATVLNVSEGRINLTYKTTAAFKYIYDHKYHHQYDWILKTDDDTFVIMDNLKYLLAHYDPRLMLHFGHQFYSHKNKSEFKLEESWDSGGAGYVLSRTAVKRLVTKGVNNWTVCPFYPAEDFYIGRCLERLGVVQGLSADKDSKPTFLPMDLYNSLNYKDWPKWYRDFAVHQGEKVPFGCCSPHTISFHYIDPEYMHIMYFLLYKLRVFGRTSDPSLIDSPFTDPDIRPLADSVYHLPDFHSMRRGTG